MSKIVTFVKDFPLNHKSTKIYEDGWVNEKTHLRHTVKYMERLAKGIKESGVCDPVLVVVNKDFATISGFGTTRAIVCRDILNYTSIPAFVVTDRDSVIIFKGEIVTEEAEVRDKFKYQPKIVELKEDGSLYIYSDIYQWWNHFPLLGDEQRLPITAQEFFYMTYKELPEKHNILLK